MDVCNDADWTQSRVRDISGREWRASSKEGETCGIIPRIDYEIVRTGLRYQDALACWRLHENRGEKRIRTLRAAGCMLFSLAACCVDYLRLHLALGSAQG